MALSEEKILEAIKEAKEKSKKRKFNQTVEEIIKLKDIDMKKPENRIKLEVILPTGRGKEVPIAFIGEGLFLEEAKKVLGENNVYSKEQILEMKKEGKRPLKKLVKKYYWFLIKADIMKDIAPAIAPIFGPRGKLPKPVATPDQIKPMVETLKKTIRIDSKRNMVIQAPIGTESQTEEELKENFIHVYNQIVQALPNKEMNIANVYVKLTMGPAIKVK